jgi:hypothetical protein
MTDAIIISPGPRFRTAMVLAILGMRSKSSSFPCLWRVLRRPLTTSSISPLEP